jgi:hypothetical protein
MNITMNTVMNIDEAIEQRLEVFARWRDCATWRNLAVAAGLDPNKRKSYNEIVKAVNRIDRRRHEQGLCLLSPLIHSTRSRRPRRGIVICLLNLGLIDDPVMAPEEIEGQRQHTWFQYAEKDRCVDLIAA